MGLLGYLELGHGSVIALKLAFACVLGRYNVMGRKFGRQIRYQSYCNSLMELGSHDKSTYLQQSHYVFQFAKILNGIKHSVSI